MLIARIIKALVAVGTAVWVAFLQTAPVTQEQIASTLTNTMSAADQTTAVLRGIAGQAEPTIPVLTRVVTEAIRSLPSAGLPERTGRTVPFTPQAPFGNWSDPREEDGCEEASLVMAKHWLDSTSLAPSQALIEILDLSEASQKIVGEWRSTNAEDTARLFREYYHYDNVTVAHDITTADIAREVTAGNLVLVPTDGIKLKNPHYKSPGPPEHMLVVYAYDEARDEFVTNDPGTKYGRGYRYPSAVLAGALYDYPTGHRTPVEHPRTAMLVIQPKP